jgi:predicted O-methyltransferase YrrM
MQIGHDQGQLLTMLARLVGARRAVEVGTFTGYSSMCIARGLADGDRLLCCDVSAEWTSIGQQAWQRAGLADRIELRIAPGPDTLRRLPGRRPTSTSCSSTPTSPVTPTIGVSWSTGRIAPG